MIGLLWVLARGDVPIDQKIGKLTNVIRTLDARHGTSVEWDIKKYKMVKP